MENVTQVHNKKNADTFQAWCDYLRSKGYSNYRQDINAKDFGVPQNRKRCFMVSILGEYDYKFPVGFPLTECLADRLEDTVDEKYYISERLLNYFEYNSKRNASKGNGFRFEPTDRNSVARTLTTHSSNGRMTDNFVVGMLGGKYEKTLDCCRRVHSTRGTAPTLTTCSGGNTEPKIVEDFYASREPRTYTETAPTIRAERNGLKVVNHKNIRKLTPKECWRLMGFSDDDFFKAEQVNSNSQLYKQAGNSIVVDVLYYIFREML